MSFFDDIKAKVEELLGGASEQIGNTVEDATGKAGEVTDQAQNLKDSLMGGDEGKNGKQ